MAAYVKMIETAGARVIPLFDTDNFDELEMKLQKINGVLFPGGADGAYYESGRFVFERIKQFNDGGVFYPTFGICQGFENMASWASSQGIAILQKRLLHRKSANLNFFYDLKHS